MVAVDILASAFWAVHLCSHFLCSVGYFKHLAAVSADKMPVSSVSIHRERPCSAEISGFSVLFSIRTQISVLMVMLTALMLLSTT
jgi:hypothetical protein